MADVVLIGYWRSEREPQWPDPRDFVDDICDESERDIVASYLASAPFVANSYRGLSPCRLCGVSNGWQEFTDGVYLWPEGSAIMSATTQYDCRVASSTTSGNILASSSNATGARFDPSGGIRNL